MKQLSEQPAHYITVGDKRLPLIAKKHPRAKSMVVRYDARKDCVKLTLPRYVSLKSGLEFAASKSGWIAAQMEKHPRTAFEDGVRISLFGEEMTLRHVGGRGLVRREGASLIIPGEKEFSARRVEDFIKRETKKILALRAGYYAAQLGVSFRSIALRESSSRWGSCSAGGGLSFCWRLAFAPFAVMDYVVAHEVAHLRHHHHGTAFWQAVETLYPGYEKQENWLKRHGQSVWQWG